MGGKVDLIATWLVLVYSLVHLHVSSGLSWNRGIPPLPTSNGMSLVTIPMSSAFTDCRHANLTIMAMYNVTNLTVTPCISPCDTDSSSPLCAYTSLLDGGSYALLLAFGGYSAAGFSDTLYMLSLPLNSSTLQQRMTWQLAAPVGLIPRARYSHTAVAIPLYPPVMIVLGGYDIHALQASLWLYDASLNRWVALGPAPPIDDTQESTSYLGLPPSTVSAVDAQLQDGFKCEWPVARVGHIMVVYRGRIIVWGGMNINTTTLGELWTVDIDAALLEFVGLQLTAPAGSGYAYTPAQLANAYNGTYNNHDPVWMRSLCPVPWRLWTRPNSAQLLTRPLHAPSPAPRVWHGGTITLEGVMYIFGGTKNYNNDINMNDLWRIDLSVADPLWQCLSADAYASSPLRPAQRVFPGLLFTQQAVYVCEPLNELWRYVLNETNPNSNGTWQNLVDVTSGLDEFQSVRNGFGLTQIGNAAVWYMMGGSLGGVTLNYFYSLDLSDPSHPALTKVEEYQQPYYVTNNASLRADAAFIPTPRSAAMACAYNTFLIIYGGLDGPNYDSVLNDLYSYDMVQDIWSLLTPNNPRFINGTWINGTVSAGAESNIPSSYWPALSLQVPPPTHNALMLTYQNELIYLWGGGTASVGLGPPFYSSLYILDFEPLLWYNVTQLSSVTSATLASRNITYDLWLRSELHSDGVTYWYPNARCSTGGDMYLDSFVIFGGQLGSGLLVNDLWMFNLTTLTWSLLWPGNIGLKNEQGYMPIARYEHAFAISQDWHQIILGFGLDNSDFALADVWQYDLLADTWQQITSGTTSSTFYTSPSDRFFPCATILGDIFYLYGGSGGVPLQDTWSYDISTQQFSLLSSSSLVGVTPPARRGANMVSFPSLGLLAFFGGRGTGAFNDLNVLFIDNFDMYDEIAHDLLALIPLSFNLQQVLAIFDSYPTLLEGNVTFPPYNSFRTLAGVINYQQIINSGFVQINVFESYNDLTLNLHYLTISQPLLIEGQPTNLADPTDWPVLNCAGTRCFNIDLQSLNPQPAIPGANHMGDLMVEFHFVWLSNGSSMSGGCMRVDNATVALTDVIMHGHTATFAGGAIIARQAALTLTQVAIEYCHAGLIGGAIAAVDTVMLASGCQFIDNTLLVMTQSDTGNNSIMFEFAEFLYTPDLQNPIDARCTSTDQLSASGNSNNNCWGQGGAVYALSSILSFDGCSFSHNSALYGAAICAVGIQSDSPSTAALLNSPAQVQVTNSHFFNNSVLGLGGAIYLSHITLTTPMLGNIFLLNSAALSGGAIFVKATFLSIDGCVCSQNSAQAGGCIYYYPASNDVTFPDLPYIGTNVSNDRNHALHGPFKASPAVDLFIVNASASQTQQRSGDFVHPPLIVALQDVWEQVVTVENSVFISVQPTSFFGHDTIVQVRQGVALFNSLQLLTPPTHTATFQFTASTPLTRYAEDVAAGYLTVNLLSQACEPGEHITADGIQCASCAVGSYSNVRQAPLCTPCEAGKYQNNTGQTSCIECGIGSASQLIGLADNHCPPCSQGTYSFNPGAQLCVACTEGMNCANLQVTASAGYWLVTVVDAYENVTANMSTTVVADAYTVPCPFDFCQDNGQCGPHRVMPASTNALCGTCSSGYVSVNNECVACDSPNGGLIFGLIVLGFAYVLLLYRLSQRNDGDGSILFYFIQIAIFQCGVPSSWLDWLNLFNLDILSVSGGTCFLPLTPLQSLAFALFYPVFLTAQLCVMLVVHRQLSRIECGPVDPSFTPSAWPSRSAAASSRPSVPGRDMTGSVITPSVDSMVLTDSASLHSPSRLSSDSSLSPSRSMASSLSWERIPGYFSVLREAIRIPKFDWNSYFRTLISIFLFSYQSVSSTTLNYLDCQHAGDYYVVFISPSIDCNSDGYVAWRVILIFFVIIWVVCVPLLFTIHLYRNRSYILSSTQHAPALVMRFRRRWGLLYEAYRKEHFWWGMIVILRRIVFIVFDVILVQQPTYKLVAFAAWNGVLMQVHSLLQPYKKHACNQLENLTLLSLLLQSILVLQQVTWSRSSSSGTTNSHMEYSVAMQVLLSLLIMPLLILLLMRALQKILKDAVLRLKLRKLIMKNRLKPGKAAPTDGAVAPETTLPPDTLTDMQAGMSEEQVEGDVEIMYAEEEEEVDDRIRRATLAQTAHPRSLPLDEPACIPNSAQLAMSTSARTMTAQPPVGVEMVLMQQQSGASEQEQSRV